RWRGAGRPLVVVAGRSPDPGDRRPAGLLERLLGRRPQGHGRPLPQAPLARRPGRGVAPAAPPSPLTRRIGTLSNAGPVVGSGAELFGEFEPAFFGGGQAGFGGGQGFGDAGQGHVVVAGGGQVGQQTVPLGG